MSLEFLDGFDHWTNGSTSFPRKWDAGSVGANFSGVTGRFGGLATSCTGNQTGPTITLTSVATRIVGFAYQGASGFPNGILCRLVDAGTTQVELRVTSAGAIQVTRNGTLLGATSSGVLAINTWYYLEFKATIHATAGAYDVHVNSVSVLSGTGVNTMNSTNATSNQVNIQGPNSVTTMFDDLYILNTSGSANNNFLGECRILTNLPTGDGASTAWTPSTGTSHYANVDDADPNDDTDYNYSSTSGQIDLYTFASISPTGAIAGVQTVLTARKDDLGLRQIAEECRSGGTNYAGANTFTTTTSYAMYREIRETDPATAAAWTTSGLNSAQFGQKVA